MNYLKILFVAALCLVTVGSAAQSPRRRPAASQPAVKPAAPTTTAPPEPVVRAETKAPVSLGIGNGQTIPLADIDPAVREEAGKLDENLAQASRQILTLQTNTLLLAAEAKKRKLTAQQLYDSEIAKRILDPTEAEIKQFIEANRDQLGDGDLLTIRPDVIALLRGAREQKLT